MMVILLAAMQLAGLLTCIGAIVVLIWCAIGMLEERPIPRGIWGLAAVVLGFMCATALQGLDLLRTLGWL